MNRKIKIKEIKGVEKPPEKIIKMYDKKKQVHINRMEEERLDNEITDIMLTWKADGFSVCPECKVDCFTHIEGCKFENDNIISKLVNFVLRERADAIRDRDKEWIEKIEKKIMDANRNVFTKDMLQLIREDERVKCNEDFEKERQSVIENMRFGLKELGIDLNEIVDSIDAKDTEWYDLIPRILIDSFEANKQDLVDKIENMSDREQKFIDGCKICNKQKEGKEYEMCTECEYHAQKRDILMEIIQKLKKAKKDG